MKSKTSRASTRKVDPPLPVEALLRTAHEPPKTSQPDAMRSFAGWNGIMIDQSSARVKPRLGLQRIDAGRDVAAWVMTATHQYRLGLPILTRTTMPRKKRKPSRVSILEPVHHAWNARHYHPVVSTFAEKVGISAAGKRVIPTSSLDALIFGNDDRQPYYPNAYPWHCVGRLETETGAPIGSAALVGRDLVLTARHVILETSATSIKFVPGFYNGQSTLGASFFAWVKSARFYEGSDYGAWDFSVLRLYQPLGDHLGFFGVRTYNDDWNDLYVWTAAGYPSMMPYNTQVPSYLRGIAIDDEDDDGDASELESENQDNSKGGSGGPLWAVWSGGPYIVGVTSANDKVDYGPFGNDYQVLNASGKAMVEMVGLAKLEIDTSIHINPPHLNLSG